MAAAGDGTKNIDACASAPSTRSDSPRTRIALYSALNNGFLTVAHALVLAWSRVLACSQTKTLP